MDRIANGNPESLRLELLHSFTEFEATFRQRYPVIWISTFLGPFLITVVLLIALGFAFGFEYPEKIVYHAFMTFFIFGRFIILTGMEAAQGITPPNHEQALLYKVTMKPAELFGLVTYMDFIVALFVTFHMGVLFRLPYVGEKIATLVWDGKYLLDVHPWIKRIAFLGLVLFVVFPTSTTGSIGGSIFGRLLGMSRALTLMGVLVGSILGNAIMYSFSKQINQFVTPDNMWIKIAGVLILIGLVVLIEIRYQRVKKKYFGNRATEPTKSKNSDAAA